MILKKQAISILTAGLSFGTAWAIRGQFGHEQGAAWAGAIGAFSIVLLARRSDWHRNILPIALSSAVGWGLGAIISYGAIAGQYSQSDNFPNAFYGLMMLFVIGALYGLTGGGLVGLTLDSNRKKMVNWPRLITEMVVGGLLVHSLLIDQLEILMTPPRCEAWAISLGAATAMLWYMARNNHWGPVRVALFSALGAGFGFAFGEFFHMVMNWIKLPFNTWNMAEYSIGFFGGIGMAFGIFNSEWNEKDIEPTRWENAFSLFILIAFVPMIIFKESFSFEMIAERYKNLVNGETIAFLTSSSALIIMLMMSGTIYLLYRYFDYHTSQLFTRRVFIIYTLVYILLSYISTGLFAGTFLKNSNHHLYILNLLAVLVLMRRDDQVFTEGQTNEVNAGKWGMAFLIIALLIAFFALLAIQLHGPTDDTFDRFHF